MDDAMHLGAEEVIGFEEVEAAAKRLEGIAYRTPLLESPLLNRLAGRRVLVKPECLQLTGSFKFRGAWSALTALDPETAQRGVIAYSSGNHAQGVAYAAQRLGIPAVIVMPADAPALKIANTRAYGAEVVLYDRAGGESREEQGKALAAERGLTLIRPFDEPLVIAGQATTGLEIAEQARAIGIERGDVAVCTGGGGLAAGISLSLTHLTPGLRVRPVEPQGHDDWCRSLLNGAPEANGPDAPPSICDAIISPAPGRLTWPILSRRCGPGIAVSDTQALHAMAAAFVRLKLVVEPGGAVGLAAALFSEEIESDPVIAVITGGNVDAGLFSSALARFAERV
ncbi:MAG: threonine/serine dehydratase [Pseudomonadota bacterium]